MTAARLVLADAAPYYVASVALGDVHLHFVWQARHLVTSTFILCGRFGICGTGLALVARLVPVTPLHFVWQAWTWSHLSPLCVAGMAHCAILCGRRGGVALVCGRRGTYGMGLALVVLLGTSAFTHITFTHTHSLLTHHSISDTSVAYIYLCHPSFTRKTSFTCNFFTYHSATYSSFTELIHTHGIVTHDSFTHNIVTHTHSSFTHMKCFDAQL